MRIFVGINDKLQMQVPEICLINDLALSFSLNRVFLNKIENLSGLIIDIKIFFVQGNYNFNPLIQS